MTSKQERLELGDLAVRSDPGRFLPFLHVFRFFMVIFGCYATVTSHVVPAGRVPRPPDEKLEKHHQHETRPGGARRIHGIDLRQGGYYSERRRIYDVVIQSRNSGRIRKRHESRSRVAEGIRHRCGRPAAREADASPPARQRHRPANRRPNTRQCRRAVAKHDGRRGQGWRPGDGGLGRRDDDAADLGRPATCRRGPPEPHRRPGADLLLRKRRSGKPRDRSCLAKKAFIDQHGLSSSLHGPGGTPPGDSAKALAETLGWKRKAVAGVDQTYEIRNDARCATADIGRRCAYARTRVVGQPGMSVQTVFVSPEPRLCR